MRKQVVLLVSILLSVCSAAQTIQARIETEEIIEGLCNQDEYYYLIDGFGNQTEARCPLTLAQLFDQLTAELNLEVDFPKLKDRDGVSVSINCEGELVHIESEFKDPRITKIVKSLFESLTDWEAGTMLSKKVDSSILYSIRIKKGKLFLNENVWMK